MSEKQQNATVTTSERAFMMERVFDAPRELVFDAFSKAEHLKHWWGPKDWTLPVCTIDFRPGGVWHYCMKSPDGQYEAWGKAVYQEIVRPERIVYTDYFSDAEGNINEDLPQTVGTVEFIEQGGKTKVAMRAEYPTHEDLQKVLDMGMEEGIRQTWDRLAAHLAKQTG